MRDSHTSIVRVIARKPARALTCAALAVAFATAPIVSPLSAYAVSAETQAELDAANADVDTYAAAYNEAQTKLAALQQQIDDNTARIAEIEEQLPEAQERASQAMRDTYKNRANSNPLLSLVLNSQSLSDFISSCVYMDEIQSANVDAIESLNDLQQELQQKKTELDQAKVQLEEEQRAAEEALAAAQEARAAAQAKAEQEEAAELARLAELAAAQSAEATAPATGEGADTGNSSNTATQTGQTVNTSVSSGGVNWNLSYDEFVNEWGSRIDAYLAGSPLAGYGRLFAESAWNSGVDPRWSPAIACIESSKGLHCFRSYNAWGWMGASFSSWEEAIPKHVSYLARNYGATLTAAAAKKYCPPTWQDWYNKVAAQMNRI